MNGQNCERMSSSRLGGSCSSSQLTRDSTTNRPWDSLPLSRRQVLASLLASSTLLVLPSCSPTSGNQPSTGHPASPIQRDYWPTADWRTSKAEAQGMDAAHLTDLDQSIQTSYPQIRSFLIVRHGFIVFERYRRGISQNTSHDIQSITKSVTSALIGIALKEKVLESPEQKIAPFFPEEITPDIDPRIKEITIKELLMMTSGFANASPLEEAAARNFVAFSLHQPIMSPPGQAFNYSYPAVTILTGIISKVTHLSALDFGMQTLFGPLGIARPSWLMDRQGHQAGDGGMSLKTREMAKFGYLYLNKGWWEGKQVVSSGWVQVSTQKQTAGGPPEGVDYGYLWWITTANGHHAIPRQELLALPNF